MVGFYGEIIDNRSKTAIFLIYLDLQQMPYGSASIMLCRSGR